MKKAVFLLFACCMLAVTKALAYEWTDGNGVTWRFGVNGTNATISGVSGYGENVTVPSTVYNGGTQYTVTGIGYYDSEYECGILTSGTNVTLPASITSINYIFKPYCTGIVTLNSSTPPSLTAFGGYSITALVPAASLNAYRTADVWKDMAARTISKTAKTSYTINSTAQANTSGFLSFISDENLINVMSLTVTGSINSYDIMVIRDKMLNLHYLDLTNANIVANSYQYYRGYSTTNDVLGNYAFYSMSNLISVKLPKTITSIGESAFNNCYGLKTVTIPNSVTSIGNSAFLECRSLVSGIIPDNVSSIGNSAFYHCDCLTSVTIGNNVASIGERAFYECKSLTSLSMNNGGVVSIGSNAFNCCFDLTSVHIKDVASWCKISFSDYDGNPLYHAKHLYLNGTELEKLTIPENVTAINSYAFLNCSSLKEIHIPSSIRSIGNSAFSGCTALKDYYAYTIEPTSIEESTFSNWNTATLHVPLHAYNNYFVTRPWSKFYPNLVQDNNYQYNYFYLTQDYMFNDAVGAMNSTPDVQLDGGSGLVVETTNSIVKLDEVHMADDGSKSASIIANGNLTVENLYIDMAVTANKWYFVSFPFRVKLSNVTTPGNFVFRYYDGQARAQNGSGGWKNVTGTYLNARQGYIFQTNTTGTLTLKVEKADMDFSGGTRQDALTTYTASSTQNASWNFVGNPHPSYFDLSKTGYTAPITVWNGSTYKAVRAGDDAYYMRPFQAFFVQKPSGTSAVSFPANGRMTYLQMQEAQAASARATVGADPMTARRIVNLTIGSGEGVADQTRVVYNPEKSCEYELDCDAAKFFADGQTQLYTVDAKGTQYAINERPQGEVNLGYVAAKSGELQISAMRMDCPVYLRDNELNIIHDLSLGGYTFTTGQGSNESRFTLVMSNTVTGVDEVHSSQSIVHSLVYDLQGRRVENSTLKKGAYIVKDGQKTIKHLNR